MLRFLVALVIVLIPTMAVAASFETTKQGMLWQNGSHWIRFDRGRWSAGVDGGDSVQWYAFLWHDHYVYEAIPGGAVESGPTLEADGSLTMAGTFTAKEKSAPVHYAYHIRPIPDGVDVQCELQKTAPLKLNSGVWLHIFADHKKLKPAERVWLEPSASGTVASQVHGVARQLHIELRDGLAVRFGGNGLYEINTESGKDYRWRLNLTPEDFEVVKKIVVAYQVKFGNLPKEIPGEIHVANQPLAIGKVEASGTKVAKDEKFELNVGLSATYENPFDPDQVRLDAEFTSPSGKTIVVPGFFMVDFGREVHDKSELLIASGNGRWKVRFTPREVGVYSWRLSLQDRSGKITGGEGKFEATASASPGFVRRSSVDPHYLAFDNGQGYYPIGHNLPIYHSKGQLGDEAMRCFAAAKENYNRWWMNSDGFGLEWTDRLGWYRQDAAARLDLVVDLASELGMYYMLCIDTHQDFRQRGWERNPFNAAHGGPCTRPVDWFTDSTAKDFYKKRLRYIVARWGYSPHILCWEFGNEIEGWDKSPDEVKLPWTNEMAGYLRQLDPFKHLITTSFWTNTGPEQYWKLDNLDIVQTHLYTGNEAGVAEQVRNCCLHQWQKFDKPHIFGEFGIGAGGGTAEKDPQGWAIHNALWSGLFGFAAGGPMPWWHEEYLDKLNLYFHFTSLANFTADLPLGAARWSQPNLTPPEYVDPHRKPELRDAFVGPSQSGWTKEEFNEFTVGPDGAIADGRMPAALLHGLGHSALRNPPTFVVVYPQPGKFEVRVGRVSREGRLLVWIDDVQALDRELPCGQGLGKDSRYVEKYKLWETVYDQNISVDVPAGKHRIRVDNVGKDWITISRYAFTGCRVVDRPNVLVWGMTTKDLVLLWLQNRDSTWFNHAGNGDVGQAAPFRFSVTGLSDGKYRVQWWETWKGAVEHEEQAVVTGGRLTISSPALTTDCAVKIRKVD